MNSLSLAIASLALAAPGLLGGLVHDAPARHGKAPERPGPMSFGPAEPAPFRAFEDSYRPKSQHQVRIEHRVIIRIAPSSPAARAQMFARMPRGDVPTRYKEKKLDGCIPIDAIAGSFPANDNRLLLFMRDHRVLSAALERACDSEAFYSGFYVERSADGMLCSRRDKLQSRAGASCEVSRLNRLVAVED